MIPVSKKSRLVVIAGGMSLLALVTGGCDSIDDVRGTRAEEAAANVERRELTDRVVELESVAQEAEQARRAAQEEARAASAELEVARQRVAEADEAREEERRRRLRSEADLVAEQVRQREEKQRMAERLQTLETREKELLEWERELEAREINLAVAEDELSLQVEETELEEPAILERRGDQWDSGRASLQPGQVFEVEILETLSSRTHRVGDEFAARTVHDLRSEDGTLVIASGARVVGEVTEVTPLRGVGGRASIGVDFTAIISSSGEELQIRAGFLEMGADRSGNKKKVIGAAVAGAILGRVLGGKGAENVALGAAMGAAAGGAAVAYARDKDAVIPAGEMVALQLEEVVTVDVEMTGPVDRRR